MVYQIGIQPRSQADVWRNRAYYWKISEQAKRRLEWIIFYQSVGKCNASKTACYFGISAKTFHKWKRRFDPQRIQSLEEESRAPKKKRQWEVTDVQVTRVKALRTKYPKWGKKKLKVLYFRQYSETISTWKIERVIRKYQLYVDKQAVKKRFKRLRRANIKPKVRIQELKDGYAGTLWHTDSIVIWWYGTRRVIFTALEDKSKVAFARVYRTNSSTKAKDFLERLIYLSQGEVNIIHSDNGSEFAGEFEKACQLLGILQVFSRVRQPKDNPCLERFNWTVQDEWLSISEVGLDDINEANIDLTPWLIEYNSIRPHENLDYLTPLEYAEKYKVLPMTPASSIFSN